MTAPAAPETTAGASPAGQLDDLSFRMLLGHFPTGVVVISAEIDGHRHGMTVNSFTSVSLRPRLVSFYAAHSSTTWPKLAAAAGFAVSILGSGHEALCRQFARKDVDRYGDGSGWRTSPGGHPVVADAVAWLDCATVSVQSIGDHDLVVGRVGAGGTNEGEPLIFHRGAYTRLHRP